MDGLAGSVNRAQIEGNRLRKQRLANEAILCWSETVAWYSRYTYTGHTLTKQADHWRLIVRATNKRGEHLIAFITGATAADCVWLFNKGLVGQSTWSWKPDRYKK